MSSATATAQPPSTTSAQTDELIDEDRFEEFGVATTKVAPELELAELWQADWDDEDITAEDFQAALRAQLAQHAQKGMQE
mmetsp:Transcript_6970/g.11851  ORF Transcript_6970/g.11851 Transcript_6970/m.11851 type:complete len:80 (+) Transcript_6970:78-317(+)|eukprot:CAMPEP_0119106606 /NCGR_PEP_ID=MMETSP1180-20130426/5204_1 /TAXON_ID=3052 ORGANISM="Chlamydomonas cf sp, Strain CCMP681" /NCGR_SAMPLE_ID=MMETSP1180 /ASSEMBLY_ACC=CAM_ASM_000741 /LENGTH=79 /DNA_ID=CAMNT_0007091971 /DNA_START=51 /DNA_END=290 /DNA_ORIENTATION=+